MRALVGLSALVVLCGVVVVSLRARRMTAYAPEKGKEAAAVTHLVERCRFDEAERVVSGWLEVEPMQPAAHYALAQLLLARDGTAVESALDSLVKAKKLASTLPDSHALQSKILLAAATARIALGTAVWDSNAIAEAEAFLRASVTLAPSSPEAWRAWLVALVHSGNWPRAEREMQSWPPSRNSGLWGVAAAYAYSAAGKAEEAMKILDAVASAGGEAADEAALLAAKIHLQKGRHADAISAIEASTLEGEKCGTRWIIAVQARLAAGQTTEAVAIAEEASLRFPEWMEASRLVAKAYLAAKAPEKAAEALQEAAERFDGAMLLRCELGDAWAAAGKFDRALDIARAVIASSDSASPGGALSRIVGSYACSLTAARALRGLKRFDEAELTLATWNSSRRLAYDREYNEEVRLAKARVPLVVK